MQREKGGEMLCRVTTLQGAQDVGRETETER